MACLAPWAFGAVRAWAEAALYLGIVLVTILAGLAGFSSRRRPVLGSLPGLAMIGLIGLALVQGLEWPSQVLVKVLPASTPERLTLAPRVPTRPLGDSGPYVKPPEWTISGCPELTLDAAVRLAAGWCLFQAVVSLRLGPGALRRLGLALAANAVLLSLFAVTQTLTWNGRIYWIGPPIQVVVHGGPFVNKNHLAADLNLGLGFALAALLAPKGSERRGTRLAAAYAAGVIVLGILASLSRGGFVAMLAAASVLVLISKAGLARVLGGLALVVALVAACLTSAGVNSPSARLATLFQADPYLNRMIGWRAAARGWMASPTLGLGLGTFAYLARFFKADDGSFTAHAENEYLEFLAEGGVVGFGLAVLMLVSVMILGARALAAASGSRARLPILGALFAIVSLGVHSLVDFPFRIPAIAVVAVMIAGHLSRAGLEARGAVKNESPTGFTTWTVSIVATLATMGISLLALGHGITMTRSEAEVLADGHLPPAGFAMPTTQLWQAPKPVLDGARLHLEAALRERPNWAEGHVRLGLIQLSQYRAEVLSEIAGKVGDPNREAVLADPLWLHRVAHSASTEQLQSAGGLLAQGAVLRHLIPAARSFLEARRCAPVWALPHAELASLDYLIPGETTADDVRRALRMVGADSSVLALAARSAAQSGDLELAARCWRRMIEVSVDNLDHVAANAPIFLSADQILQWVATDGRTAVQFAERNYRGPDDRAVRERFLKSALARLPADLKLNEAERLAWTARALFDLGQDEPARDRVIAALALEPHRTAWRNDLIAWLIAAQKYDEAHNQALIGLYYAPEDDSARKSAEAAAEALARGASRPAASSAP